MDFRTLKTSCRSCSLTELCLPRGLDTEAMEKLDRIVQRARPVQRGEALYRAGDPFHSIYTVRSGAMKVVAVSESGDEQIVGFYLPGEMLGLDGIEHDMHNCTATALETSGVCAVPFDNLEDVCKQVPQVREQLMRLVSREIAAEHRLLLMMGKKDAEERVATFLLTLSTRYKRLGYSPTEFRLSMSRQDLANYLGLTPETVSRIFTRFQNNGLIATERKFITLLKPDDLQHLCTKQESTSSGTTAA